MQKLRPREVGIPTYHFRARNTINVPSSRVLFKVSFPLYFMLKKAFGLFVILTWQMRVAITSLLRDKISPFK